MSTYNKKILILSIVAPYVLVFGAHIAWRLFTAPHKVYVGLEKSMCQMQSELKHVKEEKDKAKADLAVIPGPQLMIGYIQANHLAVQNDGGGTAYTVILKVPEDGSVFSSKPINILKENSGPTMFNLTGEQAMEVTQGDKTRPLVVECTDGDCRKFIYHFEKMTDRIGFLLKGKECFGKVPMLHSPTTP